MTKARAVVRSLLDDEAEDWLMDQDNRGTFDTDWELVSHGDFPDGSAAKRTFQNKNSGIMFKIIRMVENIPDWSVYLYDEAGDFVDGDVGGIETEDVYTAPLLALPLVKKMLKYYSLTLYRKTFGSAE